jgi:aldose 1-epimerase
MQAGMVGLFFAGALALTAAGAQDTVASKSQMSNYSIRETNEDGAKVYVLRDAARDVEVKVAPGVGNLATAMTAHGKPVLWTPYASAGEWAKHPGAMGGVPFLWPWANRIDGLSYWVNGRKYAINPDLGNVRIGPVPTPIHGLLLSAKQWKVIRAEATQTEAVVASRIELWREPAMMAQFPFANAVTTAYRLKDGVLEVETAVENLSSEPMPVSLGFHPYFQVNDAPRDEWKVRLPAREKFVLNERLIPTGEKTANPYANSQALKGVVLDDVLGSLVRDSDGWARFRLEGAKESVTVEYGGTYPVAVVYAPPGRGFVCFEPMSAPTNAFNAAHDGWFKDLPLVAPGGTWKGVFRIVPEGF